MDDFLRTPAKEAFHAQALDSWPAEVHWLLSTYVPESMLETAMRNMQVSGQRPLESVRAYGNRLQLDSAALGSLIAAPELNLCSLKDFWTQSSPCLRLISPHMSSRTVPRLVY